MEILLYVACAVVPLTIGFGIAESIISVKMAFKYGEESVKYKRSRRNSVLLIGIATLFLFVLDIVMLVSFYTME